MIRTLPIGLLAALPLVLASAPGRAQAPAEAPGEVRLPPADPRFILDLVTENDAYVRNTDRWYTSGIRLGWHSAEDNLPSPVAWLDRSLAELFGPARSRWGIAIGQTFYTPRDKQLVIPDPQDRPYAGYLFGEFTLDRRTWTTLDRFSLQLGVVGPAAQAKETQDFVHHILGDRPARGWNFQLRNEPVFNLGWDRIWRVPLAALPFGLGVDALPTLELAAGTVQIYAAGGGRLRIGQGLDQDFGPPRIRPTIADGATPVGQGFGWYAFVGAGGRAIARDIFLEGNTFRESRRVDHRPFVADLEAGIAAFWHNVRVSFTYDYRTKEFVAQPSNFQFGSISLSVAF